MESMMFPYVAILTISLIPLWGASPHIQFARPSPRAEDRLRSWLERQPQVRGKITQIENQRERDAARPRFELADYDLKDAVADTPAATAGDRKILSRLPGLRAPENRGCASFAQCAQPPLALDLSAGEPILPAIRALLRPWLWLQQARRRRLHVSTAPPHETSRILTMSAADLALRDVGLNIAPRLEGGVHLWFDRGLELASVYAQAREALAPR